MANAPRPVNRTPEADEEAADKAGVPADVLEQLRKQAIAEAREGLNEEVEAAVAKQLQKAGVVGDQAKVRRLNVREAQALEAERAKAELRDRLNVKGDMPKGRVKFVVEHAVHIAREDLDGEAGLSIEVQPAKDPIHLPDAVAKSLQAQGKGRIV